MMRLTFATTSCRRVVLQKAATRYMSARMRNRLPKLSDYPTQVQDAIMELPRTPMKSVETGGFFKAPVTSAHMTELDGVSMLDSAAMAPDGTVVHGRYGKIPKSAAAAIPLEFLALLRPAAEGAAAFRALKASKPGTVVVYGASYANGWAFCQMANAAGHAVVAVLSSDHCGYDDLMFSIKNSLNEPSVAVPEDVALLKKEFKDLVRGISIGDEGYADLDPETYVQDFKKLLIEYSEYYPDTRPAAVPEEEMEFKYTYMEKDREQWELNQGTYLKENFPPGAPPVDKAKLDEYFTAQQYELFRQKFWKQTTAIISGLDGDPKFSPPHIVQQLIKNPEDPSKATQFAGGDPWCFSIFNKNFPRNTDVMAGGPLLGAVIAVTPELLTAATAVGKAKTIRAKAEALKFLTKYERHAFLGAASVAKQARDAGKPILVIGGKLPGLETLEVTQADVDEALKAMDIDDNGNTTVNFFVQTYRANDYPFYADFAVFRANEVMPGPRQLIVLK